jgi:multiple sugar transport system permease protein
MRETGRLAFQPATASAARGLSRDSSGERSSVPSPTRSPRPRAIRVHNGRPGIFALPGLGYLIFFAAYPLYQLIVMSFSAVDSADVLTKWPGTGLTNYRSTLDDSGFREAAEHTLFVVAVILAVGVLGGTAAAVAMTRDTWGIRATLAVMVFVWALPGVVVGNLWKFLLAQDGALNKLLQDLHLVSAPVPWLVDRHLALFSLALVSGWTVLPFSVIILRRALTEVPADQLEAASLDGAGPLIRFRAITLHYLRPTLWVLAILLVVNGFRTFDVIYVMTSGGPGTSTVTLPFLAYRQAFQGFDYGLGSATAVFSLILVLLLAAAYGIRNRTVET